MILVDRQLSWYAYRLSFGGNGDAETDILSMAQRNLLSVLELTWSDSSRSCQACPGWLERDASLLPDDSFLTIIMMFDMQSQEYRNSWCALSCLILHGTFLPQQTWSMQHQATGRLHACLACLDGGGAAAAGQTCLFMLKSSKSDTDGFVLAVV